MANVNGLFEDELDADGMPVISEFGKRFADVTKDAMVEAVRDQVDERIDDRQDELVETIDAYMDLVNENVEDSVAELRKLMLLAVASIGGQDKANEFVRKVAELARAGALSSATGAWAQGGPPDSSANRQSIAGGGVSTRKESVDDEETDDEIEQARAIFREAAEGLTGAEIGRLMSLTEDMHYDGDQDKLRNDLKVIRESYFGNPATSSYVKAISRTVPKG